MSIPAVDTQKAFNYGRERGKQAKTFRERINQVSPPHIRAAVAGFAFEIGSKSQIGKAARRLLASPKLASLSMPALSSFGRSRCLAAVAVAAFLVPCIAVAGSFVAPEATDRVAAYVFSLAPARMTAWIGIRARCAARLPVWDRRGRLAGVVKTDPSCPDTGYRSTPVSDSAALRQAEADSAIEGEIAGPGVLLSINFKGIGRILWYVIKLKRVGGSNLLQSSVENAAGAPGRLGLLRKLSFVFFVGPHYTAHNLPTTIARAKFAAENAACAMAMPRTGGDFGSSLAGNLCSLVVGKSSLDDLNRGEHCIVAATRKRHLKVPGRQASALNFANYAAQFTDLKGRAKTLCADRLAEDVAAKVALYAQIDAVRLPSPHIFHDIDRRLAKTLPVASQLLLDMGLPGEHHDRLDVTLDTRVQVAVTDSARRFARKVVAPASMGMLCWGPRCPDARRTDLALAIFEVERGRLELRGGYQSRAQLLTGPLNRPVDRSLASTTKILLVPLLIEAGITRLCRRAASGLHDANGYAGGDCSQPREWLSLETALATSSNLAFFDGLRQVDPGRLRAYLKGLGYRILDGTSDRRLARSAILGDRVVASPFTLVRAFAALAFAADGMGEPIVVRGADAPKLRLNDLVASTAIQKARRIIAAPVINGTAAAAYPILKAAGCRVRAGKTGTADSTVAKAYRDKLIVIAAECGGRKFVAFALVGSPDIRRPLIGIGSAQLVQLAANAIVRTAKLEAGGS